MKREREGKTTTYFAALAPNKCILEMHDQALVNQSGSILDSGVGLEDERVAEVLQSIVVSGQATTKVGKN